MFANDEDLVGPVPQPVSLHKPISYQELRQTQLNKLSGIPSHNRKLQKEKKSGKITHKKRPVDIYPDAPGPELIEKRYMEDKRLERLKDLKGKQELILQRRKDSDKLQKFREDGKRLQREKMMEKYKNGGKLDYEEPAKKAPYDYEQEDLKMITNEERIAQDIKAKHEKIRNRPMSPGTLQRMEDARTERDKELEKRIRQHTESMHVRRQKAKGTPQQEMELAMRELEVAEQLQRDISTRRKELEYRFTAFTGDTTNYSTSAKNK